MVEGERRGWWLAMSKSFLHVSPGAQQGVGGCTRLWEDAPGCGRMCQVQQGAVEQGRGW